MSREDKRRKQKKSRQAKREEGANLVPLMVIEIVIIAALAGAIVLGLLYLKGVRLPFLSGNSRTVTQTESSQDTATNSTDTTNKFKFIKNKEVQKHEYSTYIFFGDSRIEGMRDACAQDNDKYVCKVGEGYYWMLDHIEEVSETIWTDSDPVLILEFGINDMQDVDLYIAKANELAASYSCPVFYMTVNPVDEDVEAKNGYNKTNTEIDEFNEKLTAGLSDSITVIDTNSYLKQVGYTTVDGIHYSDATYQTIYDYVKEAVQTKQ